jgi:hypothetical protein
MGRQFTGESPICVPRERQGALARRFDISSQMPRVLQTGHFGSADIRATGIGCDIEYSLSQETWKPRLGVSFGRAGGDRVPGDGKLGTFDVIYPNLGYFTDAPLFYPGNTWDSQPNVRFTLAAGRSDERRSGQHSNLLTVGRLAPPRESRESWLPEIAGA